MTADLLIHPLNTVEPTLTPERLFYLTFWILTLPMFVATVGVLLSRRVDLDTKLHNPVKLIFPLLYTGFVWVILFSSPTMVGDAADFISILVYEDPAYFVDGFIALSIFSVPSVLGFLQACLSYPNKGRFYTVVFFIVLVASCGLFTVTYAGDYGATGHVFAQDITTVAIVVFPIAYFAFLIYVYRESSDSERFFDSVGIPWLLITVIHSPLLLVLLELLRFV